MSTFHAPVRRTIEPHDNADVLELAVIDDFRSVVRKGAHRAGDLAAYIPESAGLPEGVLKRRGLWDAAQSKEKCAGSCTSEKAWWCGRRARRRPDQCGRVLLKSVSPDYLVRQGGEEHQ